jgi:signal transduction histidine kinase/ActR/RegA family two-component response regulator
VVKRELHELIDTSNFFIAFYDENTQTLKNALWADEKDHFDQWPVQNSLSGIVVTEGKPLMLTKSQIFDLAEKRNIKLLGTVAEYWVGFPLKLREKVIGAMVVQSYFARDHIEKFSIEVMEIVANQISLYIEKLRDEEQLIISKNKAEESDRLKSAFLANMSHEIRTPMNGILGFLGLLSESNLEEESKREYIEIINKSGHRLLETINDILEISQIEAGETKMVYSDVNIEDTMQFIFDFFRQQAVEKEITMEIANQVTGRQALVKTDEHKLTGILTNLIKNAIKFTEHGKIELGNYLENKELIFYVKDTGIGIPTDKIDAIFEHFVQADMNLTRSHEGSGLGLSIVKAYIHALGGNIRVNSEIDKGSTFTFSIPYNRTEMNPPRETNVPNNLNELNRKITILIAEDDAASFQFLKALLIKEDIHLIRTKNGTETVSAVKENPDISLILMDIKMAGMDGFEATRQIRHFNKKIPIIAQTAYAFPADKEKAKEAGCNDYISKPINRVILFEMINKYTSDPTPLR